MPSRFLLFSASAGSGKTFNLAVQYITLLVARGSTEYARTLAVTFTNKATAEMKERILQYLQGIWQGNPKCKDCLEQVKVELKNAYNLTPGDDEVRRRCGEALRALLHDYSRFNVSTIDSFFQNVLRNMAHELGLSARLQVDISDDTAIEMAVDHLVASLQQEDSELLYWLKDYMFEQLANDKSWDITKGLTEMARNLFKEEYLSRVLDERNLPLNVTNLRDFKQRLEEETEKRTSKLTAAVGELESIMEHAGIGYDDIKQGGVLRTFVNNVRGGNAVNAEWKPTLDKMTDPSRMASELSKTKKPSREIVAALENIKEAMTRLHDEFEQQLPKLTTLQLLQANLHPMGALSSVNEQLIQQNADANRFSLAHTPILLTQMVKDSDAPFVYERIGTRYRNVMIDEFQDTSQLQWQNFRVLLTNNMAEEGMTMVVGDVKQSIYRWRNGDWRILQGLKTQGLPPATTDQRNLDCNYRSMGNVIRFNNHFFPPAAQWLDSLSAPPAQKLSLLYADVEQKWNEKKTDKGYVRLHIKRETDDGDWAEQTMQEMGEQMTRLHAEQHVPYSQMAILLRTKKNTGPLVSHFAKNFPEIKLVSNEAFRLDSSPAVGMLTDALRVIDNWGKEDANPLPLRHLMQVYLKEAKEHAGAPTDYLFLAPEDVLPQAFIGRIKSLRTMPLYTLCEHLYRTLELKKVGQQDAYLLCFFDELGNYLENNPSDLSSFLDFWDESMHKQNIPQSAVDGVSVLTIHKSKGLEFHTVMVPFMDNRFERDRNDDMMWCTPPSAPADYMGRVPVRVTSNMKKSELAGEYEEEHDARRADILNILYVAFTRAGHNLMVWGSKNQSKTASASNRTEGDIILAALEHQDVAKETEPDIWEVGCPESYEDDGKRDEHECVGMCSFQGDSDFRQSEPARRFVRETNTGENEETAREPRQQSYIQQGKLMHYVLSKIKTSDDVQPVLDQLRNEGVLENESQRQKAEHLLTQGLQSEQVKEWFSEGMELFNECDMITCEGGQMHIRRPDRVMLRDNRIVVVDFKFGKAKAEYRQQVREYMNFMQQMCPNKQVEGYLWYVYADKVDRIYE